MAQNDLWKRYLDAGLQFTQMTQARAEAIVRDLVRAGEVQAEQTQAIVNEMVDRLESQIADLRAQVAGRARPSGKATKAGKATKKAARAKKSPAKKTAA